MPTRNDSPATMASVGLPPLVFFYTVDQLASMLNVSEDTIMLKYLFFNGRSTGMKKRHEMKAINISPEDEKPNWRVSAKEFVAFLKRMGVSTYEITHISSS